MPQRLLHWWSLPPPSTVPCLPRSCSKAVSCSARGCAALHAHPLATPGPAVQRTKRDVRPHLIDEYQSLRIQYPGYHHLPSSPQELVSLQRAPQPLFTAEAHLLEQPTNGRVAEALGCEVLQKATSL